MQAGLPIARFGTQLHGKLPNPQASPSSLGGTWSSPLSIYCALALALNAAGPDTPTHNQLQALLSGAPTCAPSGKGAEGECIGPDSTVAEQALDTALSSLIKTLTSAGGSDSATLLIANSIWTQGVEIKKAYTDNMLSLFNATAKEVPSGSMAPEVNAWVNQATKGKIPTILQDGPYSTVLANALYFKGLWVHPFDPSRTMADQTFKGLPSSGSSSGEKKVAMMTATFEKNKRIQVLQAEGRFAAAVLPYKGGEFEAVAALPEQEGRQALLDTMAALDGSGLEKGTAIKDWMPAKTIVNLPKFKVEASASLKEPLQQLGVTAAFDDGSADFSRLSAQHQYVSDVVHKVVVEVDEQGTVAAAATAVVMLRSRPVESEPPVLLVFDRPFVFCVRHRATNTPVVLGVVE